MRSSTWAKRSSPSLVCAATIDPAPEIETMHANHGDDDGHDHGGGIVDNDTGD
ncbi:hypothetical protein H7H53_18125, partial [Mycobacterium lacus]|nr:hypothetical protein [Mycobacterium lacus]